MIVMTATLYLSNDGYSRNKASNSWKKTAFVTIYKLYLHDDETIKHISINPSEISNIYLLDLDRVTEFYNASPSLFVTWFRIYVKGISRKRGIHGSNSQIGSR